MDTAAIHARIAERFASAVTVDAGPEPALRVQPQVIAEVCRFAKQDPALAFDCLSNQSGIDYPKRNEIEVVYHLYSYDLRHTLVLKVSVAREKPELPTVCDVWAHANWQEREIFDLLGVVFHGHPDLRRILLPEDWVGHPLRKDFVEPTEYHGISTKRESML